MSHVGKNLKRQYSVVVSSKSNSSTGSTVVVVIAIEIPVLEVLVALIITAAAAWLITSEARAQLRQ